MYTLLTKLDRIEKQLNEININRSYRGGQTTAELRSAVQTKLEELIQGGQDPIVGTKYEYHIPKIETVTVTINGIIYDTLVRRTLTFTVDQANPEPVRTGTGAGAGNRDANYQKTYQACVDEGNEPLDCL